MLLKISSGQTSGFGTGYKPLYERAHFLFLSLAAKLPFLSDPEVYYVKTMGVTRVEQGGHNPLGTCGGAENSQQCSTYLLQQYICFRETSGSNMGAPNSFIASGAI